MEQAIVRHMANNIDYIYTAFPINISIDYDEWYTMRLMLCDGVMKAFVNDTRISSPTMLSQLVNTKNHT